MYYIPETKSDLAECLAEPMHLSRRALMRFPKELLLSYYHLYMNIQDQLQFMKAVLLFNAYLRKQVVEEE